MKYLALLLLLIPLSLFGQVESQFNGTLNVFSANRIGSTNTFTISGVFSSTTSSYTSANSAIGDIVQVQSGSRFYWLHIYSIASNSGGVITGNVRDSSSTLTVFPTGKWDIFRPTPNLRLPLSPDGTSNASRSATFNTLALRVDEIQTSVASATNCEVTITKTSHGFRKWTPVFWNGSTYIRPTADSLVPDYIVVDSLTANTFKVATCGTYTTTLTNGLYWFTSASPGYSLTQDTTKVPLFQALNGKLILNPIVGFNLMSGSGGTADGNGIYSGSDSLSQENTYVKMDVDGDQNFLLGYFPDSIDLIFDGSEYGYYSMRNYWGGLGLINGFPGSSVTNIELSDSHVGLAAVPQTSGANPYGDQAGTRSRSFSTSTPTQQASFLAYSFRPGITDRGTATTSIFSDGFRNKYVVDYYTSPRSTFDRYGVLLGRDTMANSRGGGINGFFYKTLNFSDPSWSLFQNVGGASSGSYFKWISVTMPENNTTGNGIRLYDKYDLVNATPSPTSGAISNHIWIAGTPSFLRSQHGVATGTTDGSGDLTVTFAAAMPDATYTALCQSEGNTNSYTWEVHTKTTSSFKIRVRDSNTKAVITATSVTFGYEAKDY